MKVTMRDVAKHAGVSTATVSHVINETRFVSEETREKVLKSIEALGYSPNEVARIFKTGRKNLIGCIVPDIANSFFATIIEAAEAVLGQEGYRLIVANTKEDPKREREHLTSLTSGIVDGLIVATTLLQEKQLADLVPQSLPMVLIDRHFSSDRWDVATITDEEALSAGIEALLREGHRSIGYITGVPRLSTTKERLGTYLKVMARWEREVDPLLIRYGDSVSNRVVDHAEYLLGRGCTALIVSNNVMAANVLQSMYGEDIVKKRVSLLGYGDMEKDGHSRRMMNMIGQPVEALGREAGKLLLHRLKHPEAPQQTIRLKGVFLSKE